MSKLIRTKQGKFNLTDCINIDDISIDKLLDIKDVLDISKVVVNDDLKSKILNGQIFDNIYNDDKILFIDKDNKELAIYQVYEKNKNKIKPYIMLSSK